MPTRCSVTTDHRPCCSPAATCPTWNSLGAAGLPLGRSLLKSSWRERSLRLAGWRGRDLAAPPAIAPGAVAKAAPADEDERDNQHRLEVDEIENRGVAAVWPINGEGMADGCEQP